MRKFLITIVAVFAVAAGLSTAPAFRAGDVSVTVTYKGKGPVDDTHEIWVFLFDTPTVDASSQPVMTTTVKKSGATATFKNVTQDTVYVRMAYDDKGTYDGNAGPPPPGTPVGMYSTDGKTAAPVKPGPAAKVKVTFDDSRRMGGQ